MLDFSNMQAGLEVTILGFSVVFIVLLIIAGGISLCARFIMWSENFKAKREATKTKKAESESSAEATTPVVEKKPEPVAEPVAVAPAQDLELIAVITAAVAMQTGKGVDDLVVRSIRRVKGWNKDNYEQNLF